MPSSQLKAFHDASRRQPRTLSDAELHRVLDVFGYRSNAIVWAIEILQGRVDLTSLKCDHHPVDRKAYSLTDEQITEAAAHAAMNQLRREMRYQVDDEGYLLLSEDA